MDRRKCLGKTGTRCVPCSELKSATDSEDHQDRVGEVPPDNNNKKPDRGDSNPRMSFVGFFRDSQGQALSKERIFSSTGESHGYGSRPIHCDPPQNYGPRPTIDHHKIMVRPSIVTTKLWSIRPISSHYNRNYKKAPQLVCLEPFTTK